MWSGWERIFSYREPSWWLVMGSSIQLYYSLYVGDSHHPLEYKPTRQTCAPTVVLLCLGAAFMIVIPLFQYHKPWWNTGELNQLGHHLGWLSLNLVVKHQQFYGAIYCGTINGWPAIWQVHCYINLSHSFECDFPGISQHFFVICHAFGSFGKTLYW